MKTGFIRNLFGAISVLMVCAGFSSLRAQDLAAFAGNYQALVVLPTATNVPVGVVDFTGSNLGKATGKMTLPNGKDYKFNVQLVSSDGVASVNSATVVKGPSAVGPQPLSITLQVVSDGGVSGSLSSTIVGLPSSMTINSGLKFAAFTGRNPAPWRGSYTMAVALDDPADGEPTGSGYAALSINPAGLMSVKGKLGDGTVLSATAKPTAEGVYRIRATPYKAGGVFVATIELSRIDDTGRYRVANGTEAEVIWRKNANAKDKLFPAGFGPLLLNLSVEPWTPPAAGQTLVDLFGVAGKQFPFEVFGSDDLFKAYPGRVPSRLRLDVTGKLLPVFGDVFAPKNNDAAWAKIWTVKVNPKTGVFTGTLKLPDFRTAPKADGGTSGTGDRYTTAKLIIRAFKIEGVVVPNFGDADDPFEFFGQYHALAVSGLSAVLGGVEDGDAFEAVGVGAPSDGIIPDGTPGNYQVKIATEISTDSSKIGSSGFLVGKGVAAREKTS